MPAKDIYCKICGSNKHYSTFCYSVRRKMIPKRGKQAIKWISERKDFIKKTKPSNGIWLCHYCGVKLVETKDDLLFNPDAQLLTVDHIKPRGSNPKLRYKMENLVPCCQLDNALKGSQDYESFIGMHYPHLIGLVIDSNI